MTRVRVLGAGVDTLHVSVKGELQDGVTVCFEQLQREARDAGSPLPVSFHDPEQTEFLFRGHGAHGQPYWLSSPRFEVFVGAHSRFPPAHVQLHSPWIHALGIEDAIGEVERTLTSDFFGGPVAMTTSRIDVYADQQGWWPHPDDFHRFTCRATRRRVFELPGELRSEGRRLSGFVFGKKAVVARIYDKTLEMATRGQSWQETVWEGRDPDTPVWRIEFQFRRDALRGFRITDPAHALLSRQGLWEYGMHWLSLRRPTRHSDRDRWPEASVWEDLRRTWLGSPRSHLVRERIRQADELRLVQGLVGYTTSLAAVQDDPALAGVVTKEIPAARRYLAERGTCVEELVERKRRERMTRARWVSSAEPTASARGRNG